MSKPKKFLFCTFLLVLISGIPFLFNWVFIGDEQTHFGVIKSTISVSDWFSFWISYLSLIASSVLAYIALKLTLSIEKSNSYLEIDKNASLLKLSNVKYNESFNNEESFQLELVMQDEAIALDNLKIDSGYVEFEDLKPQQFKLISADGGFKMIPQKDPTNKLFFERMSDWYYWKLRMTSASSTISLFVTYSYTLPNSLRVKKDYICKTEVLYILKEDMNKTSTNVEYKTIIEKTIVVKKSLEKQKRRKEK